MKQTKTMRKHIFSLLTVCALLLAISIPLAPAAYAAQDHQFAVLYTDEKAYSMFFINLEGQVYGISCDLDLAEGTRGDALDVDTWEETGTVLEFSGNLSYIGIWEVKGNTSYKGYPLASPSSTGQATAVYLNNAQEIQESNATITELIGAEDNLALFFVKLQAGDFYMPGALLDEKGNCTGFIFDRSDEEHCAVMTMNYDPNVFGGAPGTQPDSAPAPDDGGNQPSSQNTPPESTPGTQPDSTPTPDGGGKVTTYYDYTKRSSVATLTDRMNKKTFPTWGYWAIGGGVVAVAALIVLLALRKRKDDPAQGSTAVTNDPRLSGVTEFLPRTPERKAPVQEQMPVTSLYCASGTLGGQTYSLKDEMTYIGRVPECKVRYPENERGVSRKHAVLYWRGSKLWLEDLSSDVTGTYIEGKGKMAKRQPVEVHKGDIIYVGEKVNRLELR